MEESKKIGKYLIQSEIGRGAMGVVYKATDQNIQRTVAIKTIRKELLSHEKSDEMMARFKCEVQAAGRLTHQNIVSVYDYGEEEGNVFIAMEFINGKELKNSFDQEKCFSVEDTVNIMSELLEGLSHAHQNGIIHRDIKPSNIIITQNGHIKITDFGVARIESSNLTQAGTVIGTPGYMSPEQCRGEQVDGRSDLFSAGIILYQLITGKNPFIGQSIVTTTYKILHEEPPNPSELNAISPIFNDIIKKSLDKDPDKRFQSAKEFLDAIQSLAQKKELLKGHESTRVIQPNPNARLIPKKSPTTPDTLGRVIDPSGQQKIPIILYVLIAIVITITSGIGWWYFSSEEKKPHEKIPTAVPRSTPIGSIRGINDSYQIGDTLNYEIEIKNAYQITFDIKGSPPNANVKKSWDGGAEKIYQGTISLTQDKGWNTRQYTCFLAIEEENTGITKIIDEKIFEIQASAKKIDEVSATQNLMIGQKIEVEMQDGTLFNADFGGIENKDYLFKIHKSNIIGARYRPDILILKKGKINGEIIDFRDDVYTISIDSKAVKNLTPN